MANSNLRARPRSVKDLTGSVFGRVTVLEYAGRNSPKAGSKQKSTVWLCSCACGAEKKMSGASLKSGNAKSCGCLQKELASARLTIHGMSHSSEFKSWKSMWDRCTNENDAAYERYKGWAPPAEWWDFTTFYLELGPKPTPAHTLDRVDNSKGYGPGNCRWATWGEQTRNTTRNIWIDVAGERRILKDWATTLGVNPSTLRNRVKRLGVARTFEDYRSTRGI